MNIVSPKIGNLDDIPLADQNIPCRQIPMDYLVDREVFHSLSNLNCHRKEVAIGQSFDFTVTSILH